MHQNNDGSTVIDQEQRFDDLMRLNKQMNNDWRRGSLIGNTQRHMAHVAEIPNVVYNHLLEKLGPIRENQKAWKAWLNDHQNRDFRNRRRKPLMAISTYSELKTAIANF